MPTSTKEGGRWSANRIRQVLSHPVLIGQHPYKGKPVLGADGLPITPHEPLVDYATWTRLEQALTKRKFAKERVRHDQRLLHGLVRCGGCGATMTSGGRPDTNDTKGSNYRCGQHVWSKCERHNSIAQRGLDAFVTNWLFGFVTEEFLGQAAALQEQERRMYGNQPEREQRQRLTQQLSRLEADRAAGVYDSEIGTERFRAQHGLLLAELERLTPVRPSWSAIAGLPAFKGALRDEWPALDRAAQRQVLGAIIDHIDISYRREGGKWHFDPERITIVPRILASVPSVPTDEPELQAS